jgi:hypothetical protein
MPSPAKTRRRKRAAEPRPPIPAAAVHDVMIEQLQYLIGHAGESGQNLRVGCEDCDRYRLARGVLLHAVFPDELSQVLHLRARRA